MKNENYINIQGWMINKLKLKGNELLLYAIIYGFSQDGKNEYYGSLSYITKALGISKPTAISLIKKLIERSLITRTSQSHYITTGKETLLVKKLYPPSKETLPVASKETLPNNNNTNNNIYIAGQSPRKVDKPFNLEQTLENWCGSSRRSMQILGEFIKEKKLKPDTKAKLDAIRDRHIKIANKLAKAGWSDNEISIASDKAKKAIDEWTLETVEKYLTK